MNQDEEVRRGFEAQRIMDDPLVKEAFEGIESGILTSMKLCPMADLETQHRLVLTLQLLGNFKRNFETAIQTGKMAQAHISDLQTDSLRVKAARKLRGI